MAYVEFEDMILGAIPGRGLHAGRGPGMALVRYEAPKNEAGELPVGYLKPSGKKMQYVLADGSIVDKHPDTGEERFFSDQEWVYSFDRLAEIESDPELKARFYRVKG
jgi:hypothetical protein